MKRIIKNKAKEIECLLCHKLISAYGFPSHLKNEHKITTDEYVNRYGEFRQNKLQVKKGTRVIHKIQCKICNQICSMVGFHVHLRDTHNLTTDEYVIQFGEYRTKQLDYNNRAEQNQIECKICHQKFGSERLLTYHVRMEHKLNKIDYVKQYIFNNEIQLCKCGCGQRITLLKQPPYKFDYITGHNQNGMTGKHHTDITKQIQTQKALIRIENDKLNGRITPWHSKEVIEERTLNAIKLKDSERSKLNDITFIHTMDERRKGIYRYTCNKCNTIYTQFHNSYFKCEKCHPRVKSQMQNDLTDYIRSIYSDLIISNTRKIITPYELDIYIPKLNIAIEFNGLYHHSKADKDYHLMKTELCEKQGIRLIHIFEDEWVHKQNIVKVKLLNILNQSNINIYARKCIAREINFSEKTSFLNEHHIQGTCNSKINIGLFYQNNLVAVMTFSLLRDALGNKNKSEFEFELTRFATSINVIGGASKLLSYFIKTYTPQKIVSYADRRWSTTLKNNLYDNLNFKLIRKTIPNYWYFLNGNKRFHRFNFTKQKLIKLGFDKNKTEHQIMLENGYKMIYDCGNLKYELNLNYV